MLKLNEVLKASKLGGGAPDYWTELFARRVAGGWTVSTITGVLPLTFTAKGGTAADWGIYGNDDVGENHWHQNAYSTTINDVSISADTSSLTISSNGSSATISATDNVWKNAIKTLIGNGEYTYQYAITGTHTNMAIGFYKSDNTAVFTSNQNTYSGTFTSDNAEYYNGFYLPKGWSGNITVTQMLVKGSTAPDHYIPYQQGVGERTKNLFDYSQGCDWVSGSNGASYQKIIAQQGDVFTVTSSSALYALVRGYAANDAIISGSAWSTGGTSTYTAPASIAYVKVVFRNFEYSTITAEQKATINESMLVKGSTAPDHYIPHGYQIPITVSQQGQTDKNYDIYIGDSPLLNRDFVDYESGKIYKAKRIHEDTVTIDGIVWDILDYDHDEVYKADGTRAKHTVTIQTHDIIDNLQYSARQAAFAFPNGLTAGTYHFTVGAHPWVAGDVNKVLTFTLVNAIPTGGQLVFNGAYNQTLVGTTISVFASPTDTTAAETVTMTEGSDGTDLGTILRSKTDTINSIDRALLGSNNWLESALRQYLNSDKAAGNVWTPQTVFDRPPTWVSSAAGFLNGKSNNFISHIGTAKKTTGLNTISDGGGTAVHDEKVFLLSRSEVFMGDEYAGGEGTPYAYYKNYSDNQSASTGADKNRIKYRAGAAELWWMRTPSAASAVDVGLVGSSGAWGGNGHTVYALGVAPACCIVLDDVDDWVKQTFYTEVDADLPAIELFKGENVVSTTLYNKPEMKIKYK